MSIHVPVRTQRVSPRGVGGPSSVRSTPENFGADQARAMQNMGGQIQRLGQQLDAVAENKRQEQLELEAIKDVQALQAASRKYADDYQQKFQGETAMNAETEAAGFYDQQLAGLRRKWEGKPQLKYIETQAGNIALAGVDSMRDYGNRQQELFKDSLYNDKRQQFVSTASDWRSTPEDITAAYQSFSAENTAYLVGKGLSPEAARLQTEDIYRQAMSSHIFNQASANIEQGNFSEYDRLMNGAQRSTGLPGSVVELARAEAQKQGLEPNLVLAVIAAESNGQSAAVSPKGARGLMQLMPATAKELGVNPDEPAENIKGGVSYLKQMLQRYHGDYELALAAYNWGPGNVDALVKTGRGLPTAAYPDGAPMPRETKNYIGRIFSTDQNLAEKYLSPGQRAQLNQQAEAAREKARKQAETDAFNSSVQKYSPFPTLEAMSLVLADPDLAANPAMQSEVFNHFEKQLKLQQSLAGYREKADLEQAYVSLEGIRDKNGQPEEYEAIVRSLPADKQGKAQSYADRLLEGDTIKSNPPAFSHALARIGSGDQLVNIAADYEGKLSQKDIRSLRNPQRARQLAGLKKAFDASAGHWNLNQAEADQVFHDIYESVPEQGFKSPDEAGRFFDAALRRVVMNKPASTTLAMTPWAWAGSAFSALNETTVYGYQTRDLAAQGYYPSSGQDREALEQALAAQGYHDPTDEQLARTYREAQGLPPALED